MPQKIVKPQPPTGIQRLLYRLPIWLYRMKLGWLLGNRFLLLNHIGRKSGLPRKTVLEVADYQPETDSYMIVSGFGKRSDWYRNLAQTPHVTIQVGQRKLDVIADFLPPDASGEAMVSYAQRYQRAAKGLMQMLGYEVDGSEENYRYIGREVIPFVALHPAQRAVEDK